MHKGSVTMMKWGRSRLRWWGGYNSEAIPLNPLPDGGPPAGGRTAGPSTKAQSSGHPSHNKWPPCEPLQPHIRAYSEMANTDAYRLKRRWRGERHVMMWSHGPSAYHGRILQKHVREGCRNEIPNYGLAERTRCRPHYHQLVRYLLSMLATAPTQRVVHPLEEPRYLFKDSHVAGLLYLHIVRAVTVYVCAIMRPELVSRSCCADAKYNDGLSLGVASWVSLASKIIETMQNNERAGPGDGGLILRFVGVLAAGRV